MVWSAAKKLPPNPPHPFCLLSSETIMILHKQQILIVGHMNVIHAVHHNKLSAFCGTMC